MCKLSKEDFIEYMTFMKKETDLFNQLDSVMRENRDIMYDTEIFCPASVDKMVELLELIFELPKDPFGYTTLSWWIYEEEWGKKFNVGDFEIATLPEEHPYRTPDLSTIEKLYEYLLFEANMEGNE